VNVGTINGAGAVTSLKTDPRAGDDSARSAVAAARKPAPITPAEIDDVTQQPMPPRFPWLSRLSQQLEAASKQRAAFPPAPMLGDNLDRTA
jgi:hypothetical protein